MNNFNGILREILGLNILNLNEENVYFETYYQNIGNP